MASAAVENEKTQKTVLNLDVCKRDFINQLYQMYDKEDMCDLVMNGDVDVDLQQPSIKAHTLVLSMYSKKFKEYLKQGNNDLEGALEKSRDRQGTVFIIFHGFANATLRLLMDLIYRKTLNLDVNKTDVTQLYNLLQLLDMKSFEDELKRQFNYFSVNEPNDFIRVFDNPANFKTPSGSALVKQLDKDFTTHYPKFKRLLLNESFEKISKIINAPRPHRLQEDNLCQIMMDWITFSPNDRGSETKKLIVKIRFSEVTKNMLTKLSIQKDKFGEGKVELLEWLVQSYDNPSGPSRKLNGKPIAQKKLTENKNVAAKSNNPIRVAKSLYHINTVSNSKNFCLLFGGMNNGQRLKQISLFDLENEIFLNEAATNLTKWDFNSFKQPFIKSAIVATPTAIFMIGGNIDRNPLVNVKRYLYDQKKWVVGPNLSTMRFNAAAASVNGCIYVTGGSSQDNNGKMMPYRLNSMEFLDYGKNMNFVWTQGPPIKSSVYGHSMCAFQEGFLCIGGMKQNGYSSEVSFYSTLTKSWHDYPDMIQKHAFHETCNARNAIYVFGGYNNTGPTSACERFSFVSRQWEHVSCMPFPLTSHVLCNSNDNYIYCFGGKSESSNSNNNNRVLRFDINSNVWTMIPVNMNEPCFAGYGFKICMS